MKVLLQRVSRASVSVDQAKVGEIGPGLVLLVGIARGDSEKDAQYLVDKILHLRIFPDERGRFDLSVQDIGGSLLVISQFTLLADTRKGRRPDFTAAAPPEEAERLFNQFVELLRRSGLTVALGRFQQHMLVEIWNDGPVTLLIDSRKSENPA
jgi:D-tyrosyl-tRNA(Tyr) deacylase